MNLRNQVQIALHELMTSINNPSVLTGKNGDEWVEVHFQLQEAMDILEGMEDSTDD